jgi:hypothetical protein
MFPIEKTNFTMKPETIIKINFDKLKGKSKVIESPLFDQKDFEKAFKHCVLTGQNVKLTSSAFDSPFKLKFNVKSQFNSKFDSTKEYIHVKDPLVGTFGVDFKRRIEIQIIGENPEHEHYRSEYFAIKQHLEHMINSTQTSAFVTIVNDPQSSLDLGGSNKES